ncbi:Vacuolar morphogenesis protein 6 [Coemansia helicoidea]|uniref:Vacuolar morphogenesis protein 6 n=1 Tax=Coemansia helicoidea TaxID=1286919 RepID=A0ACC1LC55_9FUNG|nr:Vacuolar morphogenesis protein 6 [Coemansia helicoidea]
MHHAFTAHALLRQLPVRIESAVAYGDRLLVGTATGALLVYQAAEAARGQLPAVTLVETKRAFARRAVEQLGVIKEAGVLVCLADGLVTLFDLHTLSNATPLNNTRGAHVLALHTGVEHIDGIPTLSSKLAVYAKRKVVVLEWRDSEFYKSFEYPAADRIVAMHFAAPGLLVLATAREFLTLQLPRGQWDELFPADAASLRTVAGGLVPSSAAAPGAQPPQPPSTITAASSSYGGGMWGSWTLGLAGAAAEVKTTIAPMPGERLLLCHVDIGVMVNSAGKLCRKDYTEPMSFSRAPTGITYTSSYVVAISRGADATTQSPRLAEGGAGARQRHNVEIRNIGTQALVQTLLLSEEEPVYVFNGAGGKQVWAIGQHTVWRLMPAPIQQQVEEVLDAEQYDEAISLVAQSDNILEAEKDELTAKIRWLRARWLFREEARYEEALAEFSELGATPTEAISLCPERIAGELAQDLSEAEDEPGESDAAASNPLVAAATQPDDRAATAAAVGEGPDPSKGRARTKKDQIAWKEALYALMRYLTEQRRWLQQALRGEKRDLEYVVRVLGDDADSSSGGSAGSGSGSDDALPASSGSGARRVRPRRNDGNSLPHVRLRRLAFVLERVDVPVVAMARVVDTTLLRVYLECSPGLLGPLLRVKNHCDVEQSETLLLAHRRYVELVDLYHGKELYRNALQLLQARGTSAEAGPLCGTYATVRYLVRLPADQFELVLEYVRWPLESGLSRQQARPARSSSNTSTASSADEDDWPAPETIVSMVFADDRPAAEEFPRSRVATFLRQHSPRLVVQYLEYVFDAWHDEAAGLHDDMVAAYLDLVGAADAKAAVGLRQKLRRFLKSSRFYSPEKSLARLPDGALFEERALVLSRLGRHEHALLLLVFSVASIPLAEQYCIENVAQCPGVFVLLLKILVARPPAEIADNEAADIRAGRLGPLGESAGPPDTPAAVEAIRTALHWQCVGQLLPTHHQSIPMAEALPLLPPDLPFSRDMFVYLRSQLCALDQGMHSSTLVRNLGVAEDLQARRHLARLQSSRIVVSETRTCPQCLKRIGSGTAFAVIPKDGRRGSGPAVVHYSCWQRSKAATAPAPAPKDSEREGGEDSTTSTPSDRLADALAPGVSGVVIKWA